MADHMDSHSERHPRDAFSLVLGLLIVVGAAMFLITDVTDQSFDLRWVGPMALILIGGAGLTASLRR
jgi:hypothetical protein